MVSEYDECIISLRLRCHFSLSYDENSHIGLTGFLWRGIICVLKESFRLSQITTNQGDSE